MPGRFDRTVSGLPDRTFDTRGQAGSVQRKNIMNLPKCGKRSVERKLDCPRIVILFIIFFCMFARLVVRLYELQCINGEQYFNSYLQMTTKELDFPGVRGNIYDRNGNELAYNELAYVVMFRDNGQYKSVSDKNSMFLRLVQILNQHGNKVSGKLEIAVNERGEMYFTSTSEISHKRFYVIYLGLNLQNSLPGRMENSLQIFLLRNFSGIGIAIINWMK